MRMLVISLTDGRMNDDRERVVAVVEHLKRTTGTPARIAVDNGPEVISKALDAWAYRRGVALVFSRPGKPTDNAVIEAFNSRFRDECLNLHWFATVEEARHTIEAWRVDDHAVRPHGALQQRTPAEFAAEWREVMTGADSLYQWTRNWVRTTDSVPPLRRSSNPIGADCPKFRNSFWPGWKAHPEEGQFRRC